MAQRCPPYRAARANELLDYLQAGAYPHIAAEAAGISQATLEAWLHAGHRARAKKVFRDFTARYEAACAMARLVAEIAVHDTDPKYWLKFGPGKDRPGRPGWSREVKPFIEDKSSTTVNILANPLINDLLTVILQALAPYPDARVAAAEAINSLAVAHRPQPKNIEHHVTPVTTTEHDDQRPATTPPMTDDDDAQPRRRSPAPTTPTPTTTTTPTPATTPTPTPTPSRPLRRQLPDDVTQL